MRVLAVDPGATTGWCIVEEDVTQYPETGFKVLVHGISDTKHLVKTMAETVGWYIPDVLIYEDIVMTGRMNTDKRIQAENLGRILSIAEHQHSPIYSIVSVTPQAVKTAAKTAPSQHRPDMVSQHEKDAYWVWYSVRGYQYR